MTRENFQKDHLGLKMQILLEKNLVQVETTNEVLSLVGDDVYAVYQASVQNWN